MQDRVSNHQHLDLRRRRHLEQVEPGTGLGRGNPNQVPEAQNDFIFAAIGEEMGLVGATTVLMGYLLWIFGFIGAHRFYYGKQISGVIWFFTLGLLFVGWIIDLFLIPGMIEGENHRDGYRVVRV